MAIGETHRISVTKHKEVKEHGGDTLLPLNRHDSRIDGSSIRFVTVHILYSSCVPAFRVPISTSIIDNTMTMYMFDIIDLGFDYCYSCYSSRNTGSL